MIRLGRETKDKIIALVAGIFFVLLLLEIAIRSFAFFDTYEVTDADKALLKNINHSYYKVLCLGNSHTMGRGVPIGDAYPAQLDA